MRDPVVDHGRHKQGHVTKEQTENSSSPVLLSTSIVRSFLFTVKNTKLCLYNLVYVSANSPVFTSTIRGGEGGCDLAL